MPNKSHDDLSEMLNDLAESQKRQEAELHELAGGSHYPPAMKPDDDEMIEAALAEETTRLDRSGATGAAGAPPDEPADAEVEASPEAAGDEPVADAAAEHEKRPVDELIELREAEAAGSADMLAALAQETGGPSADEQPVVLEPQVLDAPPTFAREMPSPRPAGRRAGPGGRVPAKPAANLKAVFAPVLLTFGILMLLPAIWAVMILMGAETIMHDAKDVNTMAKVMLICWPVGLGLLAGAVVSFVQIAKEKTRQRERAAAMTRPR